MAARSKRGYSSRKRTESAEATRARILKAARELFSKKGIDGTTIAQIAARAHVSVPTVYTTLKSKTGILRELMREAIFGPRYATAVEVLAHAADPVEAIALSASIARAIYEGESAELSLLLTASAFSPELRKLQLEFEQVRLDLQRDRIEKLYKGGLARTGLDQPSARHVLWMFTSRDVYRMLVHESGWSADRYQAWLADTLVRLLTRRPAIERE
jgi:AcrR family transcriptional regulator